MQGYESPPSPSCTVCEAGTVLGPSARHLQYKLEHTVGQGAYGVVWSATCLNNSFSSSRVAVKRITNLFGDLLNAKYTLREIRLLRHFNHPNITSLLDIIVLPDKETFQEIYLVMELMETDLQKVIASDKELTDLEISHCLYQVLRGLDVIHSASVLHRDLKPLNILLNEDGDVKICDFGSSRASSHSQLAKTWMQVVATVAYRAPEGLLASQTYSQAVDVWAIGCILVEMYFRRPLFTGTTDKQQLKLIIEKLGPPERDELKAIKHKGLRDYVRLVIKQLKKEGRATRNLSQELATMNPIAVELVEKMLVWDPNKRITIQEALNSPYVKQWHQDEPMKMVDIQPFSLDYETEVTLDGFRELIYQEVIDFGHSCNK